MENGPQLWSEGRPAIIRDALGTHLKPEDAPGEPAMTHPAILISQYKSDNCYAGMGV